MIRNTEGWMNAVEEIDKVIKRYGNSKNGILYALVNVSALILYRHGYRRNDRLDWFKRAVEQQIREFPNPEAVDFSDL